MATVTKVIMDKDDLQPLADGIKELEGNTSNITLSQMENAISNTNSEINRQGTLISEIISALEGKSAPGGGASVETCTVTIKMNGGQFRAFAYTEYIDGNINIKSRELTAEECFIREFILENVVCGTMIATYHTLTYPGVRVSNNVEVMLSNPSSAWFKTPANNGAEATIEIYDDM